MTRPNIDPLPHHYNRAQNWQVTTHAPAALLECAGAVGDEAAPSRPRAGLLQTNQTTPALRLQTSGAGHFPVQGVSRLSLTHVLVVQPMYMSISEIMDKDEEFTKSATKYLDSTGSSILDLDGRRRDKPQVSNTLAVTTQEPAR